MWYDDDFYDEPSEFELQMDELKESIAKSVKNEFLEEMERLREENKNLRGIKEDFEKIKRDYEQKKSECDHAMREAEDKAKRMRIEELMNRFKVFFWTPDWGNLYGPKCNKCDKNRRIDVVLPSGKTVKDECQCRSSGMKVMFPGKRVRYELANRKCGISAWYCACEKKDDRYYKLDYVSTVFAEKNIVQPGTNFDVLDENNQRELLFRTREECLAYCEYLNRKNGVTSDMIYELNGEIYKEDEEELE